MLCSFAPTSRNVQRSLSSSSRLLRPSHQHCLSRSPRHRTIWTTALDPLREGFLDLALALPWPATLPPYASTIILTTVVTRLIFTLPFSIWAKKRQWRLEEDALPELRAYRKEAAIRIATEMKASGHGKHDIEAFKKEHLDRLKHALEIRQRELFTKHSCSPTLTMLIPAVSQLPLFVSSTMLFSSVASRPTPLDDEEFLTLTSLARPDPTGTLPVALGLITLANVETASWLVGAERAARTAAIEARQEGADARAREEGKVVKLKTKNVVQGSLRLFSVLRIVIGVMVDGSIIVYWFSSATFGLFQSWGFNWWDARRAARRSEVPSLVPSNQSQLPTSSLKSKKRRI